MDISQVTSYFKKIYQKIIGSIAFYPTLLAVGLLMLAWLCLYIDSISYGRGVIKFFSFLVVRNPETARSLLSVLAGGLISLMVFSFSMVMIVLNQTASIYSPRVLPGLVSRKEHQIVLGIYLGTIGYTLAVLSNVDSETFELLVPRFSIIVNIFLVLGSFAAFIFFIKDISNIIQVGNIIKRLYYQTRSVLIREFSENNYSQETKNMAVQKVVVAWQSGYFFRVMEKSYLMGARDHKLQVKLLINQGQYILKGTPFLEVNQPVTEDILKLLKGNFVFRHQEIITENLLYGFKQITEVAVKALSPGINDPGTAVQAMDYLTDLFQMLVRLKGHRELRQKEGDLALIYLPVPFRETFYLSISSLRNYAENDIVVQAKLISMVKKTAESDIEEGNRLLYQSELDAIRETAENSFKNQKDIDFIKGLIKK